MRKFESQVQLIKYKVLRETIERTLKGDFDAAVLMKLTEHSGF